ncbi:MAG: monovalent cation/H(+) antiporter subunit G [Alphaproteobacteria bacterium]|nr:monovalent cation/H(+) antiporter subunit G [Alphaproteobacteria bacterium]
MSLLAAILAGMFLAAGAIFVLIGSFGLWRLPDFYTRLHAAGITDTLGLSLMLVGMMFLGGWTLVTVKLVFIMLLILLTSPTATHAVANAAYTVGLRPFGVPPEDLAEKDR